MLSQACHFRKGVYYASKIEAELFCLRNYPADSSILQSSSKISPEKNSPTLQHNYQNPPIQNSSNHQKSLNESSIVFGPIVDDSCNFKPIYISQKPGELPPPINHPNNIESMFQLPTTTEEVKMIDKIFDSNLTFITEETETKKYNHRKFKSSYSKRGQLRQFLSEIQFLSEYWEKSLYPEIRLVVASQGFQTNHYKILARMFPMISQIDIWDPMLNPLNNENSKIVTHRGYPIIDDYADIPNLFLICNINVSQSQKTDAVISSLEIQAEILRKIKPVAAMLRFRPPYPDADNQIIEYFDGVLRTQCFGNSYMTETRLTVMGRNNSFLMKEYDLVRYESQLCHYNSSVRKNWINTNEKHVWHTDIDSSKISNEDNQENDDFDMCYAFSILDNYLYFGGYLESNKSKRFGKVQDVWNHLQSCMTNMIYQPPSLRQKREQVHS